MSVEHSWKVTEMGNRETSPSATFSTIKLIRTGPGSNPGFFGDRPSASRMNHGTTIETKTNSTCKYRVCNLQNRQRAFCNKVPVNLTFIDPCIASIFAQHNQQDAKFLILFNSVRRCTCFRRVFRPSSGAQKCTYSVRQLSDRYCYLLLAWPGQASSR